MSGFPAYYHNVLYQWLLQKQIATTFCDQWKIRLYLWEFILEINAETPVALLPALTSAVRQEENGDVLKVLAGYGRLANRSHSWSDLQPWPIKLVEAWKERLEKADWYGGQRITALRALVTLDRCGVVQAAGLQTLLPLFLSKANAALNHYGEARYYDLSVLARWHLPLGMAVNQCDQKTLAAWIEFWEARQSGDDRLLSAIATQALLYLAEAGIPLQTSLKKLLDKLAEMIRETDCEQLFWLTLWHPTTFNSAFGEVAEAWLTRRQCTCWLGRKAAWQTLIDWDQRGILTQYGIDLLPHLVPAAEEEKNSQVLSVLAKWSWLTSGTTGDKKSLLSTLDARWKALTKAAFLEYQQAGRVGQINLNFFQALGEEIPNYLKKLKKGDRQTDEEIIRSAQYIMLASRLRADTTMWKGAAAVRLLREVIKMIGEKMRMIGEFSDPTLKVGNETINPLYISFGHALYYNEKPSLVIESLVAGNEPSSNDLLQFLYEHESRKVEHIYDHLRSLDPPVFSRPPHSR